MRGNQYLGANKPGLFRKKSEPKTLYKTSNLLWDKKTGMIRLSSVAPISHSTAMNDDAVCIAAHDDGDAYGIHKSYPARFCTCGFHGYSSYIDASFHNQGGDVILQVVASGKMFEYDKGYRFGHQRVEAIVIRNCCAIGCNAEAESFFVYETDAERFLKPVCNTHAGMGQSMSVKHFESVVSNTLPSNAPRITVFADAQTWEARALRKNASHKKVSV